MPRLSSILLISLSLFISSLGLAIFDEHAKVEVDIKPTDVIIWTPVQAEVQPSGQVTVALRLQTRQQFSIYRDRLQIEGPPGYILIEGNYPEAVLQDDPLNDGQAEVYQGGDFFLVFEGLDRINGDTFPVSVSFLGCTERICLFPYTQKLQVPLYSTSEVMASAVASETPGAKLEASSDSDNAVMNLTWNERLSAFFAGSEHSLLLVIGIALLGGLLTNLTPCVFPMIPITLRILGNKNQSHPKLNSSIYASGIVASYTVIGSIAALSGSVFGAFLGNTYVALGFGSLFILLGLTMLGYGNFNRLQAWGSRLGAGANSPGNIFLMGSGAGLVAAPCTGPILGALIIFAPNLGHPGLSLLLFFCYSLGFALPYLLLGLAAHRVSHLKAPATLQIATKAIFAAIMFGLALFYLKTPIHKSLAGLQGYWGSSALVLTLIGLVATSIVVSRRSLAMRKSLLLVPTAVLGVGLFSVTQWVSGADVPSQFTWLKDEDKAYRMAEKYQRPILVDGWADWCVACKQMDVSTFQDPQVVAKLQQDWIPLKLDLTDFNAENEALATKYGMPGLPTLVLVPPNGDLSKSVKLTGYVSSDRLLMELRQFHRD